MFNKTILILICILEALVIGYLIKDSSEQAPTVQFTEVIRDSIIRDSIYIINDSIRTEVKYIKEKYVEDSANILLADDSVLVDSFSKYIEDYNNK